LSRVVLSVGREERAASYVAALAAAGVTGERVVVVSPEQMEGGAAAAAPGAAASLAAAAINGAGGLLLAGGADVAPARYGEAELPGAGLVVCPGRDALEWELLAAARERRLPVWGICRGFQAVNVFLGGSLWQDLPSQHPTPTLHETAPETPTDTLVHGVRPLPCAGGLAELLAREERPLVNSRHHQAVRRLGEGLAVAAVADDGLIEAAELAPAAGWWVRGVQWHPENLIALAQQLALFQDFARALEASPNGPAPGPAA
jgi:putative glutamine amidotransferase